MPRRKDCSTGNTQPSPPPEPTYRAHDANKRIGGRVGEHHRELLLSTTSLLLRLLGRLPGAHQGPCLPSDAAAAAAVESGQSTSHEEGKHGFLLLGKGAGGFALVCCVGGSGEEEGAREGGSQALDAKSNEASLLEAQVASPPNNCFPIFQQEHSRPSCVWNIQKWPRALLQSYLEETDLSRELRGPEQARGRRQLVASQGRSLVSHAFLLDLT